ncbi:MAG: radical SAM family heme chaperone HemW [Bacteroidales bacterium]
MAGFYVHIPFCRQACRYCDFHFAVSLGYIPEMVEAMLAEIKHKKARFSPFTYETLYFGGGTPSVLSIEELSRLKEEILFHYSFNSSFEFTIEANPDDLTPEYLKQLKAAGVNRLSIGIQSFIDRDLDLMRRSHNAKQAFQAIKNAREEGITNLNMDLIYGIPGQSIEEWVRNLETAFELEVPHISAYNLSFEPGTVFDHWRKKGKIVPVPDKLSLEQFRILKRKMKEKKYEHYEISNFAKSGYRSHHNILYWKGVPYSGIGPSAHSFDGNKRFWNISHNKRYMELLKNGGDNYYESEELSKKDKYNEYILTGLRTIWGIDMDEIQQRFGDNYVKYTFEKAKIHKKKKLLKQRNQKITLSEKGIFLADYVVREFFMI